MKAYIRRKYGDPEVLRLADARQPEPGDHQILIKTHSISINPAELHTLRGRIWLVRLMNGLFRPKHKILGADVAGEVIGVGSKVSVCRVGDRVFGRVDHTGLSEYTVLDESKTAVIPENLDFNQASSLPLASVTALASLTCTQINEKSSILINGASGGIGTLAIQIAKSLGAEVHAICSTRNTEFLRTLWTDMVINYENNDYLDLNNKYDLVIDLVGNLPVKRVLKVMKPHATFALVGYQSFGKLLNFMLYSIFTRKKLKTIDAKITSEDLARIGTMAQSGKVKPVIDRVFDFQSVTEAFKYLATRRARGKIVISVA